MRRLQSAPRSAARDAQKQAAVDGDSGTPPSLTHTTPEHPPPAMSSSDIKFTGPQHFTYENGFQQVVPAPVFNVHGVGEDSTEGKAHYVDPVAVPQPTSIKANEYGVFHEHTFPTLLNGTNAPGGPPSWYQKESKVDVLICGGMLHARFLE